MKVESEFESTSYKRFYVKWNYFKDIEIKNPSFSWGEIFGL